MKYLILLTIIISQYTYSASKTPVVDCNKLKNDCEYYLCQAKQRNCGRKSYYSSFGYKYCMKFLNIEKEKFSIEGQEWVKKTRSCLLDQLAYIPKSISCKKVKRFAFKQHVDCYVESGYCELTRKDKRRVIGVIKRALLSFRSLRTGFKIRKKCKIKRQSLNTH